MPVQISDDAGVKNLVYNSFNELEVREGCKPSYKDHPCLWLITWDPTQPVATRPLAIQKDGTWYTYGWDLTKNICEVFGQNGYIRSTYAYTPFGSVTASGDVEQPIQCSSEYYDSELALVYYNYRHYNPTDGRWINRDPIAEQGGWNLYGFVGNDSTYKIDITGKSILYQGQSQEISEKGAKVESEFITKLRKKAKQYDTPWMTIAIGEIGNKEDSIQGNKTPCVKKYIDSLPSETARKHMLKESNPAWCACFAYWVLTQNGEKISFDKNPYDYLRALEYSKCWCKLSEPKFGALFIRRRKEGGHIGFVVGANKTHVWVLGGNQKNSVKITPYHKSTVVHYRFPCNKKSYEPILMTEKVQKESASESMI